MNIELLEAASNKKRNAEFTIYAHKIAKGSASTTICPVANPIAWVPNTPSETHAFDQKHMGMWLKPKVGQCPDPVEPQTLPSFEGVVRSAFAMYFKALQLEPLATNPACIFLPKPVAIQPKLHVTSC